MGSPLKKAAGFFKAVLPFVIEHWQAITGVFGGATIVSVIAILGRFINSLSGILRLPVKFNVPLWLVIVISPIALHVIYIYILNMITKFGKPSYLKFTSMEYKDTNGKLYKLKWGYELYDKEYVVRNITPICLNCGCELTEFPRGNSMLYCPVCRDNLYDFFTEVEAAIKIIRHKNALSMKPNKKADKHT